MDGGINMGFVGGEVDFPYRMGEKGDQGQFWGFHLQILSFGCFTAAALVLPTD